MESQRYQMLSDKTHEAFGNRFELDLRVGTILAINGAVGIKYASDERFWNQLQFRNKESRFLQTERHFPKNEG